jgi:outer membrane protein OmpA-like peptidoglycan-associated protein
MKTYFFALFLISYAGTLKAQLLSTEPDNYIVVIGAFASEANAKRFVSQAKRHKVTPKSELNKIRGLYYVYVMQTGNKTDAMIEAERLREETPMKDTWVYNGSLGEVVVRVPEPKREPEPEPEPVVVQPAPVEEIKVVATDPPPPPVKTEEEKIKEAVESKSMVLKKGEMETLDYIFFFRDAAVLRPESKFEVDRLVQLMKSHPEEKIKIHGHTNGNDKGPIFRLPEGSKDFFTMDNTVQDYGSAVKLSELRALLIRDYLVFNGINIKRMTIKAWGGKKPLFQVDDEKAEANVRVEIEVLKED